MEVIFLKRNLNVPSFSIRIQYRNIQFWAISFIHIYGS